MLRRSWKALASATTVSLAVAAGLSAAGGSELPEFDRDRMPCVQAAREREGDVLRYSRYRPDMVTGVRTEEPIVALGIDDGPDATFTPPVLRVLAKHDAGATFFVVGTSVDRHPELARQIVEEGHELANHTVDHRNLLGRGGPEVAASLAGAEAAIARASTSAVPLLRPPRGRQDEVAAEAACVAGFRSIGWADTLERHLGPVEARAMAEALEPGDIVLAHDGGGDRSGSVGSLELLLRVLDRRGFRVVAVSELLASVDVTVGR